jgi:maltose O-acetyltransferase
MTNLNSADRLPQFQDSSLAVAKRQKLSFRRGLWLALYYAIARNLPDAPLPGAGIANALRLFLVKRIFKEVGREVKIHAGVSFGCGVNVQIGDYSSLNGRCWIANDTIIGVDVMMGPEIVVLSGSHNFKRVDIPMREQGAPPRRPVVIGDDVWIGTRSIILPGTKIGSHSIIGAGSVVTKDVEEWAVVAGNPARKIRSRLDGEGIDSPCGLPTKLDTHENG